MKKITVTNDMQGQRLDKYLKRVLPSCPSGLLYKQLRKKNITLCGKKADGSELIKDGDTVEIFFSDETFSKFSSAETTDLSRYQNAVKHLGHIPVVREEEDFIVFNKPSGILSQSDDSGDYSVNDYLIGYILSKDQKAAEHLSVFRPSVCNRLDRNTSGLIVCSKTLQGAQAFNSYFSNRSLKKVYLALVYGSFDKDGIFNAYVRKDESENVLRFLKEAEPDSMEIKTGFETVKKSKDVSLLKVSLYTGKSHQIRAHLSQLGFPIIGDPKYGTDKGKYKIRHQMLHAYSLTIGDDLPRYSGLEFKAPVPDDMADICRSEFGSLEDLGL